MKLSAVPRTDVERAERIALEKRVIGCVILDPSLLALLVEVETSAFLHPYAATVWMAVRNLEARGAGVDLDAIAAEIERRDAECETHKFENMGGHAFLGDAVLAVPTQEGSSIAKIDREDVARDGAELVRLQRELAAVTDPDVEAFGARDDKPDEPRAREERCVAAALVADVARMETPPIRSYGTGIQALDEFIGGGVCTRQILTVLAPPGAGKTAWAVSTALHVSLTIPVLYCSTELDQHEVMARIAGNLLDRSWSDIARGRIDRARVIEALVGTPIHVHGSDTIPKDGAQTIALLEREAVAMTKHYGVSPLLVVDYIQDMARGHERDLRSFIGDLATDLRRVTQRLDAPMIIVSSIARAYYNPKRAAELRAMDDPTVYLAAAKESGDVDYASAVVLFLDAEGADPVRPVRIAIAKSRHGRVGFAGARFAAASGRFWGSDASAIAMSAPGRKERARSSALDDADQAVLRTVERHHAEGKANLCTGRQLRETCGIGATRVPAALERLVDLGRLQVIVIEREEGGKKKRREVYAPSAVRSPAAEPTPLELDLGQGADTTQAIHQDAS